MIDTHCHLNFPELAHDLPGVLERAEKAGVTKIIVPSTNASDSTSSVNLSEIYPTVFSAVGIHPCDAEGYEEDSRSKLKELLQGINSIVSIGEVGLDYYHFEDCKTDEDRTARKELQKKVFIEMIELAKSFGLPLIIHSRDAFADTYALLKEYASGHPTVIHCLTGTSEEAAAWIELGCFISFTGIITYKRNEELRDMVKTVPLDRVMIETDGPFLAPEGFRGKTCEPAHVRQVADCLAAIHDVSFDEVDQVTTATAERFFGI
ncbi:MAG: tatD [Patescibacteria group bacterium]|jgi:TatD DNase family protein|nr:tatD [Patescibacteria group bacterium]